MKSALLPFLFVFATFAEISAQCEIITLPYGQVQIDINRGHKIIPTKDGRFVIAGEWNGEAFLLKVDAQGQQLALKKYGGAITGQSFFQDVVEAPDGGFVAVGECNNCVMPNDSLTKVVAIKTDADLNFDAGVGVKKFGMVTLPGGFVSKARQSNPHLVRTDGGYLLATGVLLGAALNWEDVLITRLSDALAPLEWKNYHTGYFESASAIVATGDGFILPVNRAFLPEVALLKIDKSGTQQWLKPFAANLARGIAYLPDTDDVAVVGDRTPDGQAQQALLMRFDAATGVAQDSLLFGDDLDDFGYDVHPLPNGELLAGIVTNRPNLFGTYATSRIYRIGTKPLTVNCYYGIPNPDNITNMAVRSILPLSPNGKDFAATGIRGFYNRGFFHTRRDCETTEISVALCPGEAHLLPNGQTVSDSGTYLVTLPATNGCDSLVRTVVTKLDGAPTVIIDVIICPGSSFLLPNGVSVSTAGDYPVPYTGPNGCEGLQIFGVGVYPPITVGNADILVDNGQGSGSIHLSAVSGGSGFGYKYLWSNGATTPSVQNLPFGTYVVTITDALGCSETFSYIVQLVAWNDLSENTSFGLSPNPFSDRFQATLEIKNAEKANVELRFFDAQGRRSKVFSLRGSSAQDLDAGDLPAGMYFVQLLENERVVAVRRVVKE